jgi:hypothetical protein
MADGRALMSLARFIRSDGKGVVYVNPTQVVSVVDNDSNRMIITTASDYAQGHCINVEDDLEAVVSRLDEHTPSG